MDKYEFIRQLNASLKGKVSNGELNDTIAYYEDYIDTEIKKGRTEEEVVEALGSPRLLAKTIAQTRGTEQGKSTYGGGEQNETGQIYEGGSRIPLWLSGIVILLVVVFIIALVLKMIVLLAPVLAVGCLAFLLYRLFTGAHK